MQPSLTFYDAGIGKKAVVAVSGAVLFGFVFAHMLGNLQLFLGPEAYNAYAVTLHGNPPLLWGTRVVLLSAVVAHIVASMQLVAKSAAARSVGYRVQRSAVTTYAAKTMRYTGPLLAAFILFHIVHFTFPGVAMGDYQHIHLQPYHNMVNAFQIPLVAIIYMVSQILLGFHLYHGAWSLFQTLGLNHPRYNAARENIPRAIAAVVVLGNLSMPIAIVLGIIQ